MACCVFVAYLMNKLITSCEALHIGLDIQYNESFDLPLLQTSSKSAVKGARQNGSDMQLTKLSLTGLTCGACVSTISHTLEKVKGVAEVRVSLTLMSASVWHDASVVSMEGLKQKVEEVGYGANVGERDAEAMLQILNRQEEMEKMKAAFTRGIMLLTLLWMSSWLDQSMRLDLIIGKNRMSWVSVAGEAILSCVIQYSCARFIYLSAFTAATRGRVNMDTLVALSNTLGMLLSISSLLSLHKTTTYFTTTAGLTVVILGGRYLDALSRKKSASSLTTLYCSSARSALVKRHNTRRAIPAALLHTGDEIIIPAYNTIPVDSYVLAGVSQVDESIITGENVPVTKQVGSLLRSGSRNGNAQLSAVVYKEVEDSTLTSMIEGISQATERKASIESRIEGIMLYFVFGVLGLTLCRTGLGWLWLDPTLPLSSRLDITGKRAMTMLLAACPCALGLAVPSAIMAAIDGAWAQGILVTNGAAVLERLRTVTCIVLDKTGTLTEGKLKVQRIKVSDHWKNDWHTFCLLMCTAEEPGAAVHPAGQAIFEHFVAEVGTSWLVFKEKNSVVDVQEVPGQGVSCTVASSDHGTFHVVLGNLEMMNRHDIIVEESDNDSTSESIVHIAINNEYAGSITLSDSPRQDASATISRLRNRNLKLLMLTGDTATEASRISSTLAIPLLAAQATPTDKLAHITTLQDQGETVLMAGDGLNDSAALAAASVGVMVSANRRCATLGGDVLILSPRLAALADLFDIADEAGKLVRSNLAWAVSYNVFAMALAMGAGEPVGLSVSPAMGAMLMSASSVGIAVRSLLVRRRMVKGRDKMDKSGKG